MVSSSALTLHGFLISSHSLSPAHARLCRRHARERPVGGVERQALDLVARAVNGQDARSGCVWVACAVRCAVRRGKMFGSRVRQDAAFAYRFYLTCHSPHVPCILGGGGAPQAFSHTMYTMGRAQVETRLAVAGYPSSRYFRARTRAHHSSPSRWLRVEQRHMPAAPIPLVPHTYDSPPTQAVASRNELSAYTCHRDREGRACMCKRVVSENANRCLLHANRCLFQQQTHMHARVLSLNSPCAPVEPWSKPA